MSKQLLLIAFLLLLTGFQVSAQEHRPVTAGPLSIDSVNALEAEILDALRVAAEYESMGDHDSALDEYLSLVEVVAQANGDYSPRLLEPLAGLSRTYIALGYAEEAELSLRRAQHITHRNDGVYSPRQIEFVEMMVDLSLKTGAPLDADKQQQFLFFVSSHHFTGIDGIHAYTGLANWYTSTGQYRQARKILEEVITIIQVEAGESDLRLLEPLKLISRNRRLQGVCCSERSLEQAIDILDQHNNLPGDIVADVYSELADAYTLYGKEDIAAGFYATSYTAMNTEKSQAPQMISMSKEIGSHRQTHRRMYQIEQNSFVGYDKMRRMSWDEQLEAKYQPPQIFTIASPGHNYGVKIKDILEMTTADQRSERSEIWVGTPFQFISHQLEYILPATLRDEASLASILIELNFTVSETGSVHNIEFTNSNAPVKLNRLMKNVIKKARFRPGLVEGQPVITHNVTLSQSFQQNPTFPGPEI